MSPDGKWRVGCDIGGVISKHPSFFDALLRALSLHPSFEVFIISDMHPRGKVLQTLRENGFGFIPEDRVLFSDYEAHGEGCKEVLLREWGIDVMIDDHPGYLAAGGASLMLGVWPSPDLPYWSDRWKTDPQDGEFGRRRRR